MSHQFLALWCRGLTGPCMSNSYVLVQESALLQKEDRRSESVLSSLMLRWETGQIWEDYSVGWRLSLHHRLVNVPTGVNKRLLWPWKLKWNPFKKLQIHASWACCYLAWNILSSFPNWYKNKCLVIRFLHCQNSISSLSQNRQNPYSWQVS